MIDGGHVASLLCPPYGITAAAAWWRLKWNVGMSGCAAAGEKERQREAGERHHHSQGEAEHPNFSGFLRERFDA
jgi:hypothetical protein